MSAIIKINELNNLKDKNYKKKYSSFSLDILDESVETPEHSPTTSPIPSTNNLCGAAQQTRGHGSQLLQAEQPYRKTNPQEPELIPTAKLETFFISKLLAMVLTKMILTLITHEQPEK